MNCDTLIGTVTIGGDLVESSIVSGIGAGGDGVFGTDDDSTVPGSVAVNNNPGLFSTIASVTVKGLFLGDTSSPGNYGIVAAQIGKVMSGGPANDIVRLSGSDGTLGDFFAREDVGS